jgi:hypothetical protein
MAAGPGRPPRPDHCGEVSSADRSRAARATEGERAPRAPTSYPALRPPGGLSASIGSLAAGGAEARQGDGGAVGLTQGARASPCPHSAWTTTTTPTSRGSIGALPLTWSGP